MVRPKSSALTDAERQIMAVIWKLGQVSVREIADELNKKKPVAYTTVQTMCKILVDKGVATYRKEGRAFIYSAKISQSEARAQALKSLVNQFFGGSSVSLAQHLISEKDIDLNDLQELQRKINESSSEDLDK